MKIKSCSALLILNLGLFIVTGQEHVQATSEISVSKTKDKTLYGRFKEEIKYIAEECGVIDLTRINPTIISNSELEAIDYVIEDLLKNPKAKYKILTDGEEWTEHFNSEDYKRLTLVNINGEEFSKTEEIIKQIELAKHTGLLNLSEIDMNEISETEFSIIEAGVIRLSKRYNFNRQLRVLVWSSDLSAKNFLKLAELVNDEKLSFSTVENKGNFQKIRHAVTAAYDTNIVDLRGIDVEKLDDSERNMLQYSVANLAEYSNYGRDKIKLLVKGNKDKCKDILLSKCNNKEKEAFEVVKGNNHYKKYLDNIFKRAKKDKLLDLTSVNLENFDEKEKKDYEKKIGKMKNDGIKIIKITYDKNFRDKLNKDNNKIVKVSYEQYKYIVEKLNTASLTHSLTLNYKYTNIRAGNLLVSKIKQKAIQNKDFNKKKIRLYVNSIVNIIEPIQKNLTIIEIDKCADNDYKFLSKVENRINHATDTGVIDLTGIELKDNDNIKLFLQDSIRNFAEENKEVQDIKIVGKYKIRMLFEKLIDDVPELKDRVTFKEII